MALHSPFACVAANVESLTCAMGRHGRNREEAEWVDMLLDSVRTWAEREIDDAQIDDTARIDPSIFKSAADMGLFGLTIGTEYGGAGMSLSSVRRVVEEIAVYDRSVAVSIGLHNGLGMCGLLKFGNTEQKQRYLPKLACGEYIAAFAATEPGAGSHIAGVSTTAIEQSDQTLLLNGAKCFVTNGGIAGVYTILAKTPGLGGARRGFSLLLVDRDTQGVTVSGEEHKLGMRGTSTTMVTFDDVRLGKEQVLGVPGEGLDDLQQVLSWGRTLLSAGCLGAARKAAKQSVAQVIARRQFGKLIGEFGQMREKIATMHAQIYTLDSLLRMTTAFEDILGNDIVWPSTALKIFATECVWQVADEAVQVHGGGGFIEDTGVARILRDCRITRIFEGANEVLRVHLATGALGFCDAGTHPLELPVGPLQDEAARFDAAHSKIFKALTALRDAHGVRILQRQELLAGISDAIVGLLGWQAVLLRAAGQLGASDDANLLAMVKYCGLLAEEAIDAGLHRSGRLRQAKLATTISDMLYRA